MYTALPKYVIGSGVRVNGIYCAWLPGETEKLMKLVGSHVGVSPPHGHEILFHGLRRDTRQLDTQLCMAQLRTRNIPGREAFR